MKSRLAMLLVCSSALLLTMPATTTAGSGGNGGTVPQIGGTWHGQYTWMVFATGATAPSEITRQVIMTLNEDAAGNLTGSFCLGQQSPGCFWLKGKVQSNGAVQIETGTGGGGSFKLSGIITGTMACLDGSTGTIIAGTFQVREGSGSFSFNSCPVQ